jgi:hypothetical protein
LPTGVYHGARPYYINLLEYRRILLNLVYILCTHMCTHAGVRGYTLSKFDLNLVRVCTKVTAVVHGKYSVYEPAKP